MNVYISGHVNPDTDSVASAIAYAYYKQQQGVKATPVCLGKIVPETRFVLDKFGFEPPRLMTSVKTQVCDLLIDTPPAVGESTPIKTAWDIMRAQGFKTLPVADETGRFIGLVTAGDIAQYDMQTVISGLKLETSLGSLTHVLNGTQLNAQSMAKPVCGTVAIAVLSGVAMEEKGGCILLAGEKLLPDAIASGPDAIVICGAYTTPSLLEAAKTSSAAIIVTPYDLYRATRLVTQSMPVGKIMAREGLVVFRLADYLDDVREKMLTSRFRSYPVLDDEGRIAGALSRYHLIRPHTKSVILVDHNETALSFKGLEQARILEIIDHHRLADIQTFNPMYFRNEPVGSTATIIAAMFGEAGFEIPPQIAGLLLSAILSDTILFKSPTSTEKDKVMAGKMAGIAGLSIDEFGKELFDQANDYQGMDAEALLFHDFKELTVDERRIGIGQLNLFECEIMLTRKQELLNCIKEVQERQKFDLIVLMLTDVQQEGTHLLFASRGEWIRHAFPDAALEENIAFLPGVMSRKKQIVPALLGAL